MNAVLLRSACADREEPDASVPTVGASIDGPMGVSSARGDDMTLCPIALAVHCTGCPIVKVCPAKRTLGDYATHTLTAPASESAAKPDATTPKASSGN